MRAPTRLGIALFAAAFAGLHIAGFYVPALASPADGNTCFAAAERIEAGESLSPAEREEAHQACRRAISLTASVLQKYQFDEADFVITGKRHKY